MRPSACVALLALAAAGLLVAAIPAYAQAVGSEFQINTYTTSFQLSPSAAMDSNGNFVVVWRSFDQDGSGQGIFGQRFDAAGARRGSEFQINTYTTDDQSFPSAAMDPSGDFVVVWGSSGQDGSGSGIFGQRFDAAGAPRGAEFQVNTYTTYSQSSPTVAVDGSGNFVVTWTSDRFGSGLDIFGQRFGADGSRRGSEFQVNTFTPYNQIYSSAAMDSSGNFVVVWVDLVPGHFSSLAISGQRFDAAGNPLGAQFQVNTNPPGSTAPRPSVAMNGNGNFVVAWPSFNRDGTASDGIFAQRFSANGSPQGSEFQVNTYTTGDQRSPSAVMDSSGNFVVVWHSYGQDGSNYGIFGQRFNADGSRRGAEFQVNTCTAGSQSLPTAAMSPAGDFVVAWQGQDADSSGIFGQRYAGLEKAAEGDGKALDYTADTKADLVWYNHSTGQIYLWPMNGASPTAFSPVATVGDLNWRIVGQGDFNGDGKADLIWQNQCTRQIYLWLMNGATPTAFLPVATVSDINWRIVATADFNGDGDTDLVWQNQSTGQVVIWLMNGATVLASTTVATVSDLNWRIVVARDFTGDGKADLVWRHRSTGAVYLWPMNGATPTAFSPVATVSDLDWAIVASGDYNGDGKSDLVWYNGSTGQVFLWTMNGATPTAFSPVATVADLNWGIVAAGDFNADGKADLVWYNRATGQVYLWQMNGATPTATSPVATVADMNWSIVHTK